MSNVEEVKLSLRKRAAKAARSKAWTCAVGYKKSRCEYRQASSIFSCSRHRWLKDVAQRTVRRPLDTAGRLRGVHPPFLQSPPFCFAVFFLSALSIMRSERGLAHGLECRRALFICSAFVKLHVFSPPRRTTQAHSQALRLLLSLPRHRPSRLAPAVAPAVACSVRNPRWRCYLPRLGPGTCLPQRACFSPRS